MKRLYLLLFFSVWFCIINAQIQKVILGCTLGHSSKSFVEQSLKRQGYVLEKCNDPRVYQAATFYDIKDGVSFGGINWDYARLRFINGKFASISFVKNWASKAICEKLKVTLMNKYKKYFIHKYGDYNPVFDDKTTELILMGASDGEYLSIDYSNKSLFDDNYNQSGASDL